jgi:hypothetical protein
MQLSKAILESARNAMQRWSIEAATEAADMELTLAVARTVLDEYRAENPNSPHLYALERAFGARVHRKAQEEHKALTLALRAETLEAMLVRAA